MCHGCVRQQVFQRGAVDKMPQVLEGVLELLFQNSFLQCVVVLVTKLDQDSHVVRERLQQVSQ